MKKRAPKGRSDRPYRQVARAQAAQATAASIIDAFEQLFHSRWFEEVTLEDVARIAGVTVQTVIRRFGGKSGLLSAHVERMVPHIKEQRTPAPGNIADLLDRVIAVYEQFGDAVIRNLAQEPRVPELQSLMELGRREHRRITREAFARQLAEMEGIAVRQSLDLLVIATDVYTWKLLRRDMGRTVAATRAAMRALIDGALRPAMTADRLAART